MPRLSGRGETPLPPIWVHLPSRCLSSPSHTQPIRPLSQASESWD